MPPCDRSGRRPARLTLGKVTEILVDSGLEALLSAFVFMILLSIGYGIVSGLWHQMTPSRPPVALIGPPAAEADPSEAWETVKALSTRYKFGILFAVIFVAKTGLRLTRFSSNRTHRNAAAWMRWVGRGIEDNWFGLFVSNAFGALVAAIVWQWATKFSGGQWITSLILQMLSPAIHTVMHLVPGGGTTESLVSWYDQNQFKFAFWFFYLTAICDDLGLPNLKTLGRWLWHRFQKNKRDTSSSPASPAPAPASSSDPAP